MIFEMVGTFNNCFWQGELQYFIGVQLDGSEYTEAGNKQLLEQMQEEGTKLVGCFFYSFGVINSAFTHRGGKIMKPICTACNNHLRVKLDLLIYTCQILNVTQF